VDILYAEVLMSDQIAVGKLSRAPALPGWVHRLTRTSGILRMLSRNWKEHGW